MENISKSFCMKIMEITLLMLKNFNVKQLEEFIFCAKTESFICKNLLKSFT